MSETTKPKRRRREFNPLPWVALVIALIIGGIWAVSRGSDKRPRPAKAEETLTIVLPPPPPPPLPPPPPPKEEPPPEQDQEELVEEEPIDVNEPPPEAPPEAPSEDLGTGIAGNGPDMGLTRGGGNGRIGGSSSRGGKGSPFNRYALGARASIEDALRRDPATRRAVIQGLKIEFWPDKDGLITRARVIGSSSDPALDQAVRRVLVGLRTPPAANPAEMPPSVRIRISARPAGA